MATLATFFKRSDAIQVTAGRTPAIRAQVDPFQLRALPNDTIYFHSKKIDNSRVLRQADPAARGECYSAYAAVAVVLTIGSSLIAPHVASRMAGYQLEKLKAENQMLLDQKRALDVQEAALVSPSRFYDLADTRKLGRPGSDQIIHLDAPASSDTHFASNAVPGSR